MKKSKVELLAPAGSYESLKAAINAGCDAVYIGGSKFGARAYADNPKEDMLIQAIEYAHLHEKAIYLTVNTLLKDEEIENQLYDYLLPYYKNGLDAVIVQDIGVFKFIKDHFPNMDIHASTQMTVCNYEGAEFLESIGASRIVTARELSLEEIKEIHDKTKVEIESFVHGALCYCYSGQCFLSSFIGGRSGNRGRCAQPCRLPYKVIKNDRIINKKDENYVLSPKDMCTLDIIPDIIESGVYSFKIEGRMKKPEYSAGVVRIYRKYIDMYLENKRQGYKVADADRQELLDIFNRCGFNEGYYKQHNGRSMITLKEPQKRLRNEKLYEELSKYTDAENKLSITGDLHISLNCPLKLTVRYKNIEISCEGEMPQMAKNQPLVAEKIKAQIQKTGNTPFVFSSLNIDCKEDVFIPVKFLNDLRRMSLDKLRHEILAQYYREIPLTTKENDIKPIKSSHDKMKVNVYIESSEYLNKVLEFDEIDSIYIDSNILNMENGKIKDRGIFDKCHEKNKKVYIVMPHIFRNTKAAAVQYESLLDERADGIVIKNYEEINYLKKHGFNKDIIADYNLYSYNRYAHEFWKQQGIMHDTASLELNFHELLKLDISESELIVYGYMPVMVSAQCIHKTVEGCDKNKTELYLKDRYNKQFFVKNNCKYCYNTIYNCQPLVLLDCQEDIKKLNPLAIRINLTNENPNDIEHILKMYIDSFVYNKPVKNVFNDFTRGHFKRGIE